ncbi:unnamed protein product, partial [Darwinula stevensoni]
SLHEESEAPSGTVKLTHFLPWPSPSKKKSDPVSLEHPRRQPSGLTSIGWMTLIESREAKKQKEDEEKQRRMNDTVNVREETREGEGGETRVTTISELTLRPTASDNEANITCRAIHNALLHRVLARSAILSVLYPPGQPEIIGYRQGESLRAPENVTLQCKSRGGNPPAELTWYKNGIRQDVPYTHFAMYQGAPESVSVFTFRTRPSDHHTSLRCEASNKLTPHPLIERRNLTVHFGPEKAMISGRNEGRVGEVLTEECVTTPSNPRASVDWMVDGLQVGGPSPAVSTHYERHEDGGWVTRSVFNVTIGEREKSLALSCHATNSELGTTVVEMHIIQVIHPPKNAPSIMGYSSAPLEAGNLLRLTCISIGGNPLPTLKWFRNDKEIKEGVVNMTNGEVATVELTKQLAEEDNGASWACEAHHPALPTPNRTQPLFISVFYPPSDVTIEMKPDQKLRAGKTASLTCTSEESNPTAVMTWFQNGVRIPTITASAGSGGDTAAVVEEEEIPGRHGGNKTRQVLRLPLTSEHDDGEITCQATNTRLRLSIHDVLLLSVRYKPVFPEESLETIHITEGEAAVLNVSARGNPKDITYTWEGKDGKALKGKGRVFADGPILNITRATKDDDGFFQVSAKNDEGRVKKKIHVSVKYPPVIREVSELAPVSTGDSPSLHCTVDGNPEPRIEWRRLDFPFSSRTNNGTAKLEGEGNKGRHGYRGYLNLLRVIQNDTGTFQCVASNDLGETSKDVNLLVKFKPEMDGIDGKGKAAAEEGGTAELDCVADGAPEPEFYWQRDGATIHQPSPPSSSTNRYSISKHKVSLVRWQSTLKISNVTSRDYGSYRCTAQNELGFGTLEVTLNFTSHPDPPLHVWVTNVTHQSMVIRWKPGFDGGLVQFFRVRYRILEDGQPVGGFRYLDVDPVGATSIRIDGLSLGTTYAVSVMAFNSKGESGYTLHRLVTTDNVAPPTSSPSATNVGSPPPSGFPSVPRFLIVAITVVGVALLFLNVLLVAWLVRRRLEPPVEPGMEGVIPEVLGNRNDLPQIVIIAVSVVGTVLLLINIVLVACFVRRKQGKKPLDSVTGSTTSDGTSSKSATMEMYPPSTYNDTVTGETLSSISEKSERYSHHDDSGDPYPEETAKRAHCTYLIDHIEPPPQYATYPPPPPSDTDSRRIAVSQDVESDREVYAEELRRSAYNQKLAQGERLLSRLGSPYPSGSNTLSNGAVRSGGGKPDLLVANGGGGLMMMNASASTLPRGLRAPILTTFQPTPPPTPPQSEGPGHLV